MNRLSRWLTSISINLACAALFYLWKFEAVEQAGNVVMFWLWFVAALGITLGFATPSDRSAPRIRALEHFNFAFGIATLVALAAYGHFVLATLYLVSMFCIAAYRSRLDRFETERAVSTSGTKLDSGWHNRTQDEIVMQVDDRKYRVNQR
jgi:hypothetical protein